MPKLVSFGSHYNLPSFRFYVLYTEHTTMQVKNNCVEVIMKTVCYINNSKYGGEWMGLITPISRVKLHLELPLYSIIILREN